MDWRDTLHHRSFFKGSNDPVLLDDESAEYLGYEPELLRSANWLIFIHTGLCIPNHSPYNENATVNRLIKSLEKTHKIFTELSPDNKTRIGIEFPYTLESMIKQINTLTEKPLHKQSKHERLYNSVRDALPTRKNWGKCSRDDTPNEFQKFMAVVVHHVEGNDDTGPEAKVVKTTKAYNRLFKGQ